MTAPVPYCVNCIHCVEWILEREFHCVRPINVKISPVTGRRCDPINMNCENERNGGKCGPNGKFFEPKPIGVAK